MKQSLSNTLSSQRVNMLLSGTLGLVALGLVAVGIYGVLSFSVAQRTHEIGVRMALGSRRVDVLGLVMAEGIMLTVVGLFLDCSPQVLIKRRTCCGSFRPKCAARWKPNEKG